MTRRNLRVLHLGFEDPVMPGAGGGSVRTREIDRRLAAAGMEITASAQGQLVGVTEERVGCPEQEQ